jgi:hypothetical protein
MEKILLYEYGISEQEIERASDGYYEIWDQSDSANSKEFILVWVSKFTNNNSLHKSFSSFFSS